VERIPQLHRENANGKGNYHHHCRWFIQGTFSVVDHICFEREQWGNPQSAL